jgi:hypothetical protein
MKNLKWVGKLTERHKTMDVFRYGGRTKLYTLNQLVNLPNLNIHNMSESSIRYRWDNGSSNGWNEDNLFELEK